VSGGRGGRCYSNERGGERTPLVIGSRRSLRSSIRIASPVSLAVIASLSFPPARASPKFSCRHTIIQPRVSRRVHTNALRPREFTRSTICGFFVFIPALEGAGLISVALHPWKQLSFPSSTTEELTTSSALYLIMLYILPPYVQCVFYIFSSYYNNNYSYSCCYYYYYYYNSVCVPLLTRRALQNTSNVSGLMVTNGK